MICFYLKYYKYHLGEKKPEINRNPRLVRFSGDVIFNKDQKKYVLNPRTFPKRLRKRSFLIFDDSTTPPTLLRDDESVIKRMGMKRELEDTPDRLSYYKLCYYQDQSMIIINPEVLPQFYFSGGNLYDISGNLIMEGPK